MIWVSIIVSVLLMFSINAKPTNKLSDEHLKETIVSIDDKGKLSWGVQVEPPEDMDGIQYEIDPRMRIWNNMKDNEEGKDYLKPEEDLDEMYHPSTVELQDQIRMFGYNAKDKGDQYLPAEMEKVRVYLQAEEDMDDLYHKDPFKPVLQQGVAEAAAPAEWLSSERYTKPEEDLDDLYHKKILMPVRQQQVPEAPVGVPSQKEIYPARGRSGWTVPSVIQAYGNYFKCARCNTQM